MKGIFNPLLSVIFFASCLVGFAEAQVDPSSALLLRSSGQAPQRENLDSSRYRVRKDSTPLRSQEPRPLQSEGVSRSTKQNPSASAQKQSGNESVSSEKSAENKGESVQAPMTPGQNNLRKAFAPGDYRTNIVDLHVAPTFIYNDSQSNFWYRRYIQSSPGFMVGADLWLTPEFGVNTTYTTSSGASVEADVDERGKVGVENDWFSAELKYRKTFGLSPTAPGVVVGLGYSEYELKVSSASGNRIGVKSAGVRLRAEAILPKSPTYQWRLGVEFMPRLEHEETGGQVNVESGGSNESSRMGVSVGGKFIFSREHQMFWSVQYQIERNLFSGSSNVNDPRANTSPVTGVEATNAFTIFSLGYTWGH